MATFQFLIQILIMWEHIPSGILSYSFPLVSDFDQLLSHRSRHSEWNSVCLHWIQHRHHFLFQRWTLYQRIYWTIDRCVKVDVCISSCHIYRYIYRRIQICVYVYAFCGIFAENKSLTLVRYSCCWCCCYRLLEARIRVKCWLHLKNGHLRTALAFVHKYLYKHFHTHIHL